MATDTFATATDLGSLTTQLQEVESTVTTLSTHDLQILRNAIDQVQAQLQTLASKGELDSLEAEMETLAPQVQLNSLQNRVDQIISDAIRANVQVDDPVARGLAGTAIAIVALAALIGIVQIPFMKTTRQHVDIHTQQIDVINQLIQNTVIVKGQTQQTTQHERSSVIQGSSVAQLAAGFSGRQMITMAPRPRE